MRTNLVSSSVYKWLRNIIKNASLQESTTSLIFYISNQPNKKLNKYNHKDLRYSSWYKVSAYITFVASIYFKHLIGLKINFYLPGRRLC